MPKRSKALAAAQARYEQKRPKTSINTRLSPEELADFDARRGESSRSEMVLTLIRDFISKPAKPSKPRPPPS